MAFFKDYHNWLPSSDQELLLKAALLKGHPAVQAWQECSQTLDLDQLDYGSRRLLPLLHHNLTLQLSNHVYTGQFRKFYLDTWAKNQILFRKISPLLQSLWEAGIDTLVLKGAAFTVRYYKDFGVRPMEDFDFLVPTRQVNKAIDLLCDLDWVPQLRTPHKSLAMYISVMHSLNFSNKAKFDIDLHWHVFNECLAPEADRNFWESAIPFDINGIRTQGLDPTDDFFHICIHGVRWNKMPPIRWVADAVTLLNSHAEIDWDRLVRQAEIRRLTLPLKDGLAYLKDHFAAPVPQQILETLSRMPVSKMEIKEYKTRMSRPGWSSNIPFMWIYYPRIAKDTGRLPGIFGFIKYLQNVWGLNHVLQVPLYVIWGSIKRLLGRPSV